MNARDAAELATQLLRTHGDRGFQISMPDAVSYKVLKDAFNESGRDVGPPGDLYLITVEPKIQPTRDDLPPPPHLP